MSATVLRLLLVLLFLIVASRYLPPGADEPRPRPDSHSEILVRDLLYADLQTRGAPGPAGYPLTISRVGFETRASAVVPDLVYHWASYTPEWIIPALPSYSVVGEREGRLFLVTSPTSWSILSHGWTPTGPQSAIRACAELLKVLSHEGPDGGPIHLEDRVAANSALMSDEVDRVLQEIEEPTSVRPPSRENPRWEVLLWVVRRGPERQVTRFHCMLPATQVSSQEGARVAAVDSISLYRFPVE